ncbi:MAG: NADH-quinone oxidoreductase subunit J [Acidimicrobiales bacterium]|nr:NADH-quinone oxidoreductase subunit J [Acidimicrobiales bacterium]
MEWAVFIGGALICVLGAFGVITQKNPVHAAVSLIGTFFGIAVLFIAQDAEFLAAVEVIVYAGSIVVLFLFVIMLLGVDTAEDLEIEPISAQRPAAIVAGVALAAALVFIVVAGAITGAHATAAPIEEAVSNPVQIGRVLFTDYLWAFEITSVLLVIAVVGAVTLARFRPDAQVDEHLPADELRPSAEDGTADPAEELVK